MWKTFRPGTPSVEKYYYVKEKDNGLHNTDGCCQKRNYYKGASGSSRKRADGYSPVNAAGGRGKSSNSCKQKPQMPGSKRYRLHVKDQDQCKPGNFQRLQRPGYGASESKWRSKNGRRVHYGLKLLGRYPEIQKKTDCWMPGYHWYCTDLWRSGILS